MVDGDIGRYHDHVLPDQNSSCEQDQGRLISGTDGFEGSLVSPSQSMTSRCVLSH